MLTKDMKNDILKIKKSHLGFGFIDAFVTKFDDFVSNMKKPSTFLQHLEEIDERCLFLRLFLNYHYQVCNGGHQQYWDNGYADSSTIDCGCFSQKDTTECDLHKRMIKLFEKYIPIDPVSKQILDIMKEFPNYLIQQECSACGGTGRCDDEDEDSMYHNPCIECNGSGYKDEYYFDDWNQNLDSKYYNLYEEFLKILDNVCENWLKEDSQNIQQNTNTEFTEMKEQKKPRVKLIGTDGNAFALMGKVSAALREAGLADQIEKFQKEAMSGDYDHLLVSCMKYADVY